MMSYDAVTQFLQDQSTVIAGTALATVSAAAAALWLSFHRDKPMNFPVDLNDQSVEIEPGVRASKFAADGKLIEYFYEDARTTHESLVRGLKISKNGQCIGTRQPASSHYEWISYQELYDRAQQLGSAFVKLGLNTNDETFVGIYSPNCTEWVVSEEACSMFSMVVVPLYDTLGYEACEYIINQTEMKMIVCDRGDKAELLLKAASGLASLKTLVVIQGNTLTKDIVAAGRQLGIDILSFEAMLKLGRENMQKPVPPKPETICTLCYTSGTTGTPKGIIISHKAMIACISGILAHNNNLMDLSPTDVHMAYLPLAHMFERLNHLMFLQHGAQIGFNCGDIRLLLDDLAILKPTVFPTVPRLLNRIYDKVQQRISSSWLKSAIYNMAVSHKMNMLKRGIVTKSSFWDWLVFGRVQKTLGGRIRGSAVGSAPMSETVLNFTRCSFGCFVFEAYGQTEVTAAICMTLPHENQAGHVGPPIPCCHVKLVDIPEMEYYAKDQKGEVCVRSSAMMNGYYKDPEKTKEAIDEDGWVHTGDVGQWLPNGTLRLIDRKKHIFKLAQGEYIAPEKVESVYIRSPFVEQVFVDGDGLQTFPVAIVIPDGEYLPQWAKNELGLTESMESLCKNTIVIKAVLRDLVEKGKEGGLKGFEQVKEVFLSTEHFTVENGLLTPTLKSKRPAVRERYKSTMQEMYNQNSTRAK